MEDIYYIRKNIQHKLIISYIDLYKGINYCRVYIASFHKKYFILPKNCHVHLFIMTIFLIIPLL